MAFPSRFLDELRSRVGLAEVIGRRVRLQRRGREYLGLCPFHNEKTPSFTVNEEKGFYHCFGCGAHGDVIGFAMAAENLSFPEAVERLAAEAGLEVPRASPEERARERRRASLYDVIEAACAWFEAQLRGAAGRAAREYLAGRGLDEAAITRFRLGFAPEQPRGRPSALAQALGARGIDIGRLIEAGLLVQPEDGRAPYERFRGRIIFPIADRRGRIIAFGGRLLGPGEPKYLNSPDTPLFRKGEVLYGLAQARAALRDGAALVVTEGYMDVIALVRAGFAGAVAPLGTALTEAQLRELWRVADEPVLCFDGDAAGQRAAGRAAERALPLLRPGKSLRFAFMPAGEDPDSLLAGQGAPAMRRILDGARPLVEVLWELEYAMRPTDTPERRADLESRLERRVRAIADRAVQQQYRNAFRRRVWEAFAAAGPRRRGTRDRRPGTAAAAAGGLGAAIAANLRRRQQIVLAALVNHPELIEEFAEELVAIELDPDLDKLREALHQWAASRPGLDAGTLCCHLSDSGFGSVLEGLLGTQVLGHARFARSDAAPDAAREGIRHTLALLRQARQRAEIKAHGRAAAEAGTKESEARFLSHHRDLVRGEREAVELNDDIGTADSARGDLGG